MNKNRIALIAVTAVIFTACSSTKKETPTQQELDYHTPGSKKPGDMLIVPPDLTGITQENRYTLPAGSGAVRASQIEPKRLRLVCKTPESAPWLFLLEGKKFAKPFLKIEPTLFVRSGDGMTSEAAQLCHFGEGYT